MNYKKIIEEEGNRKEIEYRGVKGLILRVSPDNLGHLCGYVRIEEDVQGYYHLDLEVHGGVTFSGQLEGEEGYWVGFDCAHAGDITPMADEGFNVILAGEGYTYKNMDYVENQIENMIDQILDV